MNIKIKFILALDETKIESSDNDSVLPNQNSNTIQASEKQTLKIEEVFTSSTRQSGKSTKSLFLILII
jgi:hypothetical protein